MNGEVRLNIGAGSTYIPGFVNVDVSARADVRVDLGDERLPFDDSSVDLVFSYHTLEHIQDYLFALGEIHRVLKHGGRLLVGVPYVTSTEFNLVNPFHKQHFNEYSFDFFDTERLKGMAAETNPISFRKIFHRFHYTTEFDSMSEPIRTWCRRHLFNVVKKIDFGLLTVKAADAPLPGVQDAKARMLEEFDAYLRRRVKY
jgi:SAM-dependent methyltransferase